MSREAQVARRAQSVVGLGPGEIRGRVLRSYTITSLEAIDGNLKFLVRWLADEVAKAPEFGFGHLLARYRRDCDRLLDARLALMAALPGPPPPAHRPASQAPACAS